MLLLYILYLIVIFYWQLEKFKERKRSRLKANVFHAILIFVPIVLYCATFLGLVGIEEITHKAIVSEGFARSFPMVIVVGSVVSIFSMLIFAVTLMFIGRMKA